MKKKSFLRESYDALRIKNKAILIKKGSVLILSLSSLNPSSFQSHGLCNEFNYLISNTLMLR